MCKQFSIIIYCVYLLPVNNQLQVYCKYLNLVLYSK